MKIPKYNRYGYVTKAGLTEHEFCRHTCKNEEPFEERHTINDTRAHIEAIIKNVLQDEDTDCGNEVLCSVIASRCAEQIMERFNLKP